ncbi:MAG: translation initiation factor IF-2 [Thermodesulfovibrionales bacterium]|nr:translation initiation factor IF-2 [Thermodesulfovibrionales bacterium]
MTKIRIYELAKKLGVPNKSILNELDKLGIEGKTHSSSIEPELARRIADILRKKTAEPVKKPAPPKEPEKKVHEAAVEEPPVRKPKEEKEAKKFVKEAKQPKESPPAAEEKKVKKEEPEGRTHPDEKKPAETVPKAPAEEDDEIKIPERFRKEIEIEKVEKFKVKPGMQRAFQTIRKIEPKRWNDQRPTKRFGGKGRHFAAEEQKPQVQPAITRKKTLKLQEGTTVKEFAELISIKLSDVIKKFMELGYMPTINQPVDTDAALLIAEGFGAKLELASIEEDILDIATPEEAGALVPRPPVITIMGHVDHGKTSLLDAIRKTKVTETEAGGITQHIGAYNVKLKGKFITFLDTPGHEAFTSLRARGAKVTDIVVLVVAADDGVMPQTIEAINHAKAANVPILVAINKIDKPDANPTKVKNELSERGIISEEWGGKNIFVEVSAKNRIGIEHLLEMILLQAEIMELKANPDRNARGTIIESKLDKGRGPIATVVVQSGTLKIGDAFIAGIHAGKVRALIDDNGKRINDAGSSMPVEVIGFSDVPTSGDIFTVVEDEKRARQIALIRQQKQKLAEIARARKLTLDELYAKIKEGEIRELNIIIKGDAQGSVEAVKDALENITHPQVKVKAIHSSVGGINESDVMLAAASSAIILGFNVRPELKASQTAEKEGVDIRLYTIIYEAIEDVRKALEGLLAPTLKEKILGRAEVRQIFPISKIGTVAGCYVIDGTMHRASDGLRVIRDNIVVYEGKIATLKRFKDDAKEVHTGYECGIMIENFNDLKVGDIIENYVIEKIATKL